MKKHKTIIGFALIIAIAIILVAIGGKGTNTGSNNHGAAPSQNNDRLASKTDKVMVPDFMLQTLDGDEITLSEYRDDKPVILDFWASWCHNCRRAMPKTEKLYEQYKDQVEVIAVNLGESEKKARQYVESEDFSFPVALDPTKQVSRAYNVTYTNTNFFINTKGELVDFVSGDIDEQDFLSLINS